MFPKWLKVANMAMSRHLGEAPPGITGQKSRRYLEGGGSPSLGTSGIPGPEIPEVPRGGEGGGGGRGGGGKQ